MALNDPPATPLGFAALPGPLRARIEAELAPGERLLWAAQPDPKRPRGARRSRASTWVWAMGWTALALICLPGSLVASSHLGTRYEALGVLGVVLGAPAAVAAFLVFVHLVADRTKNGPIEARLLGELYALTDRRALIWQPVENARAVSLHQYPRGDVLPKDIERIEYPDGSGDLRFGGHFQAIGFLGVAEVRRVDSLFRQTLVAPPSVAPPQIATSLNLDDYEEPF